MHLSDFSGIARRRWRFLVAVPLVCLAVAGGYVASVPTTYTAHTRLYVSMATGTLVNDSYQGGLAAQQRMASYSYVAGGATVAERVINDLGLPLTPAELQQRIKVVLPPATTLLDISVTDSTPDGARVLTDKVAAQFRQLVGEMETTVVGAAPAAQATVIEFAQTPTVPTSPRVGQALGMGLLAGVILGCLLAFVRDRLDRTVRTTDQLAAALPVPVLATVPGREPERRRAIAQLRARLAFVRNGPNAATLMVTSFSTRSVPGIALRLAMALADSERRVALIDADVSCQGSSVRLGMLGLPGVAEWLRSPGQPVDELMHTVDGVGVIPIGATDERTSALVTSERFVELAYTLRERFDYVLVDVPPATTDATATALSGRFDGTLAVVELGTTSLPQVHAAATRTEAGLIGAVAVTSPLPPEPGTFPPVPPQQRTADVGDGANAENEEQRPDTEAAEREPDAATVPATQ